jgi:hypothetical protein
VITCALAACASKDGGDRSDNETMSVREKPQPARPARKDAGTGPGSDAEEEDAGATTGGAGVGEPNAPTIDAPPDKYDCTYAEVAKSGHGYWFCTAKTGREAARHVCGELGGDFLIIDDAQENAWIVDHVMDDTYIGYADALEEGKWVWVDGSKAAYTNWDEMQPSETDFAFIEKASGRWKSTTATARAFACEGKQLFDVAHDTRR